MHAESFALTLVAVVAWGHLALAWGILALVARERLRDGVSIWRLVGSLVAPIVLVVVLSVICVSVVCGW